MSNSAFSLIVADVHLDSRNEPLCQLFGDFLSGPPVDAEALYLLGDLFEAWLGDDAPDPGLQAIYASLKALSARGTRIYLQHGNRDFLIGDAFCASIGATLLEETKVVELYGEPTLLMHGDQLCTDDLEYQTFKQQVRAPESIAGFLSQTVEERIAIARHYRSVSMQNKQHKAANLMDVNQDAVVAEAERANVSRIVHGHTHRPAVHSHPAGAAGLTRYVVGDWGEYGTYLRCDNQGCELKQFPA